MPSVYNKNLTAADYDYYIAAGASKIAMNEYNTNIEKIASLTTALVEAEGAQKAQISVGHSCENILGLEFLDEIPLGWKPHLVLTAVPDSTLTQKFEKNHSKMRDLVWGTPHRYLNAHEALSEDGRNLLVLAKEQAGQWFIACPKGRDGQGFIPKGAAAISLEAYTALMGVDNVDDLVSPSLDEGFADHKLMREYPFEVKPENKEKHAALYKAAWNNSAGNSNSPVVPWVKPTLRDKATDSYPVLKKLGL